LRYEDDVDDAHANDTAEIHPNAHTLCALARLVKFEVACELVIEGAGVFADLECVDA
jgi:hypothetical protein